MKNQKPVKKLLAGLLTVVLLASLVPAALASPAQEDLLDILEQLYGVRSGVMLLDADGGETEYTTAVKKDADSAATVTLGPAAIEDGTASVPVYVTASAGLNGMQMTVAYGEGLTWIGAESSEDFYKHDVRAAAGDNTLLLTFAHGYNVTDSADSLLLTTLTFTLGDDVDPGTEISVTGEVDYVTYTEDDDENYIIYSVIYGTVDVENCTLTVPGAQTALEITVINSTGATPAAAITTPEGGWVEGENTFTVSADVACVVAVKNADGTYTRLTAAANDDGSYSFAAALTEGSEIVVAVKGDMDENGAIDISDILALIDGFTSNGTDGKEFNALQQLTADTDASGEVDISDILGLIDAYTGSGLNW